jgi:Flp pilus assembly protein TadD
MNRDHVRFLVSGILFGFLVGYIVAYGVHEPRVKMIADRPPEAGNLGMTSAAIGPAGGMPPGGPAAGGAQGAGGQEQMALVFEKIAALRAAIEKNPRDTVALTQLGNMFQDVGKFDQAIGHYKSVLEVNPRDVDVRTDMGICLRETGRPDEALAEFRRSVEIDPDHWQTWLNIAIVSLFDKGDAVTAATALGKVETLNPSYQGLPSLKEAIRKARAGG